MISTQYRIRAFLCLLALFACFGNTAAGQTSPLTVKEGKLLDKDGNIAILRGMSLFWSQWMPQFYNAQTVQWLAEDWKINVLRAAMAVERGGYLEHPEKEKAKIFAVIDACIAADIYVIVDWHDHNAVDHEAEAVAFFTEVAEKYGKHPHIIYEIYNEPLNIHSWEQIKKYHTAVVKAIRSIDENNVILLGSSHWSQAVDEASESPLEGFDNIAYTFRFYSSDPHHQEQLRSGADTAIKNGLCVFVSEWGVSESSGGGAFNVAPTTVWLKWMEENQLSWCAWSIADKAETSAALRPGVSGAGGWADADLTPSGRFLRNHIRSLNMTGAFPTPLRALRLDNTEVDDEELKKVCFQNPELVELTLGGTKITDAGLAHLLQLTKLRKVRLARTTITDAGMNILAKIESLQDIDVSQTAIGDQGLWELRTLPNIKILNLYWTQITDRGLDSFRHEEFRSAAVLERLNLDRCPITDSGIAKLTPLTNLLWMHLGRTALTDTGLDELAKLKPLKEVIVTRTGTTPDGVAKLRRVRPDLNVRDNISENIENSENIEEP